MGEFDSTYVLLKYSHVEYLYSHLVKVVKLLMPQKIIVFLAMIHCMNCQMMQLQGFDLLLLP
jgi:hypothetical protein